MKKCFAFLLTAVMVCLCSTALAVSWEDLMKKMDWTADTCSYTVDGTSISRNGKSVSVSGGTISGLLRFVNKSMWGDDWQTQCGWHTESGTYTFQNVTIDTGNDVEVWAHQGDEYKIVLEKSVTGDFGIDVSMDQSAKVELVNNTVLKGTYHFDTLDVSMDEGCAFTLSGTGKVYPAEVALPWDLECSRNMHMTIRFNALADDDQTAVEKMIGMLEDVHIDKAQFADGEPQICCLYSRYAQSLEGFEMLMEETAANSLSIGETALQIEVSAETDGGAVTLKSKVYPQEDGTVLCFAELLNALEESWWLQDEAALYIPYPEGIGESTAMDHRFWIEYPSLFGEGKSLASDDGIECTPYGLKITVRELLPFVLNWEEIRDPGEVTWQEVVSGADLSGKAPSLQVTKEDGRYLIDGGNATTISDVKIDCMDPQSTMGNGTYVFRNVKLKNDVEVLSVSGNALGLELESSVVMSGVVALEAGSDGWEAIGSGDISARIACDTRSIYLTPINNSIIRLENTGTTGNISMECSDHSRVEIVNDSPLRGPVFQLDDHCTADITLNGDIGYLVSWLWGGSSATYTSNGDVIRLMNLEANSGSRLTFINNSVILNDTTDPVHWDGNEWGDFQLKLAVDEHSAITFGGSGSIMPGTQMYDYYTGELCGPVNGASVVFHTVIPEVTDDHAANRRKVYDVARNIAFDWKQVKEHPGAEKVIAVRRDEERPDYTYVTDLTEPRSMRLPAKMERIENGAFDGCEALERVVISEKVRFIGDKAFDGCPGVVLIVPKDSYAHGYAKEHGIRYAHPLP